MGRKQHSPTSRMEDADKGDAKLRGPEMAGDEGEGPRIEAQFPLPESESIDEQPVKVPFRSR